MATAVAPPPITSAAGILTLLEENDLRATALEQLDGVVDQFWAEIANCVSDIEALHEDPSFSHRNLAALVASKVYYHLEEYGLALKLALAAGPLFDVTQKTQFTETIIGKAVDDWIKFRRNMALGKEDEDEDRDVAGLERVVNAMFAQCEASKNFKQALGIAMDAHHLELIEKFILAADDSVATAQWVMQNAQTMIVTKSYRDQVLELLVKVHQSSDQGARDWPAVCECYFYLDRADEVAEILVNLLGKGNEEGSQGRLMAYQIAFDLASFEKTTYMNQLLAHPRLAEKPAAEPASEEPPADGDAPADPPKPDEDVKMEEAAAPAADAPARDDLENLRQILSGKKQIDLHLEFLYRNNHSDLLLLDKIKTSVDGRASVTHNAIVIAHSLMQCGTTHDVFLRTNLEWLSKAVHWAKFTATASLGVIHKGHREESMSIVSTYLPNAANPDASPYSEGGALYALGLIHANCDAPEPRELLLTHVRGGGSEALKAGACLGLGICSMLTGDDATFENLLQVLHSDSAIAGEAAGFAIGLVLAGTGNERAIEELVNYAHDTQHEKIIRACAVGVAIISLRREEAADELIYQLSIDKDAILRYGAMLTIGLAYCGTCNPDAIRKLLHFSVSDVSDDVRRAAVTSLGFVMCNDPKQLPKVLKLLSESYNPHVRYGAAMAIGIACAGRASMIPEAVSLLEPLRKDPSDFVRQGALIASGLLFMQTSDEQTDGKVGKLREEFHKVLGDKHEDLLCRFGAIVGFGLLDAGGRNSVACMWNKGSMRLGGAIGLAMFIQMWYWFPLVHFISLALTPTALIGLNERLRMPKNFVVRSEARPSVFAYPEAVKPPSKDVKEKAGVKATLSVKSKASKVKISSSAKDTKESASTKPLTHLPAPSDAASNCASASASIAAATMGSAADDKLSITSMVEDADAEKAAAEKDAPMDGEKKDDDVEMKDADDKEEKKEEKQLTFEVLSNPCRIVQSQESCVRYYARGRSVSMHQQKNEDGTKPPAIITRYEPVNPERKSGFILLRDLEPDAPEDILEFEDVLATENEKVKEPSPPEPFTWQG